MLQPALASLFVFVIIHAAIVRADAGPRIVGKILSVEYDIEKSNPPNLVVRATGQVPTSGYRDEQLVRAVYTKAPADGIQDYYLMATPPNGPAATVLSVVKGKNRWNAYTDEAPWLMGIRVHGIGDGVVLVHFDKSSKASQQARMFIGVSNKGSLQGALDDAIAQMTKALGEGGVADAQASWEIVNTNGVVGGFAGQNKVTITISAKRVPPWKAGQ